MSLAIVVRYVKLYLSPANSLYGFTWSLEGSCELM